MLINHESVSTLQSKYIKTIVLEIQGDKRVGNLPQQNVIWELEKHNCKSFYPFSMVVNDHILKNITWLTFDWRRWDLRWSVEFVVSQDLINGVDVVVRSWGEGWRSEVWHADQLWGLSHQEWQCFNLRCVSWARISLGPVIQSENSRHQRANQGAWWPWLG